MSNLRNKLIRLAHDKPELRAHLLPILKEARGKKYEVETWCVGTTDYGDEGDVSTDHWYRSRTFTSLYAAFEYLKTIKFPRFPDYNGKPSSDWGGDRIVGHKDWKYDKRKERFYTGNEFSIEDPPKEVQYKGFYADEDQWTDVKVIYYVSIMLNGKALDASELTMASAALKSGRTKDLPKV